MPLLPWVDFSSGYFQRAADQLPKQGATKPWKLNQNYLSDLVAMRFGAVDDGVLEFKGAERSPSPARDRGHRGAHAGATADIR